MSQQQTLKGTASFTGIGLHSGNKVRMTFLPAAANTGIRFRRVDLDGKPEIEARIEQVADTLRSTTLARGNARIHTVEHVLAAFAGCGVDNAVVELDAGEPPVADGSARQYVKMIEEAGIVALPEKREPYKLSGPLEINVGESCMTAFPHDTFKITCTSADKQGRFTQFYSIEITPESWARELAHARTFCFFEEIEALFKNGLIKGGSLENAVIIREDAVLTNEPLRYPEEFVRHKILDIIGDLSLVGRPLQAHIIAVKPSHAANCELAKAIYAQMRKPIEAVQTFSPPPESPKASATPRRERVQVADGVDRSAATPDLVKEGASLNIDQVMQIIPHRYPFIMVDRILKIEGNRVIGQKNVTIGEPYFEGHFPGHPIMPGVLQLEAMAQVAGILLMRQAENAGKLAYFMSAENVKWRKPVRPGDVLIVDVEMVRMRGKLGKAKGVCKVNDDVVSEAEITFVVAERE